MLWNLEMRDAAAAEVADLMFGGARAGLQLDPREHGFTQPFIRQSDDVNIGDLGPAVKELLDLARVYIFAAANDHVFGTAGDVEASVGPHGSQIAGVQPAFGINGAGGGFGFAVVAFHHQIAAGTQFTALAGLDG